MNMTTKTIDLDAIELVPLTECDNELPSYVDRFLAKRAIFAPTAANVVVENLSITEKDSAFQRMMSSVTGLFKPKPKMLDKEDLLLAVLPGTDQHNALPAHHTSVAIKSQKQLRTLYYLLHADKPEGIPIVELKHLTGAGNLGQVVSDINAKFDRKIIGMTEFPVTNKTGKSTPRGNYWLTDHGKLTAQHVLENSGYIHKAIPDRHYLNRPSQVALEFIGSHSLDSDDLLFLRDGKKSQPLRLLYLLRAVKGGWVPRYVADELLDSANVREVVRTVKKKLGADAIESTTRTMLNRDSGECEYGLYRLADGWGYEVDRFIQDKLASACKVTK